MVVIRYTWHIDDPHFAEVRKLFTEIRPPASSALRGVRGYAARTGRTGTLALEYEFDSWKDWEEFLPQLFALPENADKFRRWGELVREGATIEVWDLLESM
jgi:hypothetical protein